MANPSDVRLDGATVLTSKSWLIYLIVALLAGAIYLGCSISPPSLMDDVDAAVAQTSRNMAVSGGKLILTNHPLGHASLTEGIPVL